jgi:hypothetical protein
MKNIKISIFCTMIIATSISGMEVFTVLSYVLPALSTAHHIDNQLLQKQVTMQQININNAAIAKDAALSEQEQILANHNIEQLQTEHSFRRCLIDNRTSLDLGSSGIPKDCEDSAKVLRLLGRSNAVDEMIANFKK